MQQLLPAPALPSADAATPDALPDRPSEGEIIDADVVEVPEKVG